MSTTKNKDITAKAPSEEEKVELSLLEEFKNHKAAQQTKTSMTATGRTGTGILVAFVDSKKPYLIVTCSDRHEFDRLYDQMKRFRDKRDYDYVTIKGSRKELWLHLFNDELAEKRIEELRAVSPK
jgi:hypothetical protein